MKFLEHCGSIRVSSETLVALADPAEPETHITNLWRNFIGKSTAFDADKIAIVLHFMKDDRRTEWAGKYPATVPWLRPFAYADSRGV